MTLTIVRRTLVGLCLVAIAVAPAACGKDGGTDQASTPTSTTAKQTCSERLIAITERADVKAAAYGGTELSAEAQAVTDAFDRECTVELDAMSDADTSALFDRIDPTVLDYLGAGDPQPFEHTGTNISGISDS